MSKNIYVVSKGSHLHVVETQEEVGDIVGLSKFSINSIYRDKEPESWSHTTQKGWTIQRLNDKIIIEIVRHMQEKYPRFKELELIKIYIQNR